MGWTRKSSHAPRVTYGTKHRFEHWYRENQVYLITARCRGRPHAFAGDTAKAVFWDRFKKYTAEYEFFPWGTSLLDNHYHTVGYLRVGEALGPMMRKPHGSVAKLVNDLLPERLVPFWGDRGHQNYFDGCLRDEKQCRLSYRYVLTQSVRHGLCAAWWDYAHTHVDIELERGLKRALERQAFLPGVRYKRYLKPKPSRHGD